MSSITKAIKLELNHFNESKTNWVVLLLVPILLLLVFYVVGSSQFYPGLLAVKVPAGLQVRNYDAFAPAILPAVILFLALQLSVLRIVAERSPYGTLDRELLAIPRTSMYLGKFIANAILVLAQVLMLFAVGLGTSLLMRGAEFGVLLILFLVGLVGVSLGLLFSVFSKTKEQATQLVPLAFLAFLVLGFIISPETMPSSLSLLAVNTPLALGFNALVNLMLVGTMLNAVVTQLVSLLGWSFVLLVVGMIKFHLE